MDALCFRMVLAGGLTSKTAAGGTRRHRLGAAQRQMCRGANELQGDTQDRYIQQAEVQRHAFQARCAPSPKCLSIVRLWRAGEGWAARCRATSPRQSPAAPVPQV